MIYAEEFNMNFIVKEDLSYYAIIRDKEFNYTDREYIIYDYDALQEVVAPKALAWWPDD